MLEKFRDVLIPVGFKVGGESTDETNIFEDFAVMLCIRSSVQPDDKLGFWL